MYRAAKRQGHTRPDPPHERSRPSSESLTLQGHRSCRGRVQPREHFMKLLAGLGTIAVVFGGLVMIGALAPGPGLTLLLFAACVWEYWFDPP
jgi:hypothetical protein